MPTLHQVAVYTFDELNPEAKDRARAWMRDSEQELWDAEFVLEDAAQVCELLGIDLSTHAVKLHGGGTRYDPDIYYSGFCSQGDGASFAGQYAHKKGSAKAIQEYAPLDTELHRIGRGLLALQAKYAYKLRATIRQISSHHAHEYTVTADAELDTAREDWTVTPEDEEALLTLFRDLMRWIYKTLEAEYEYRLSDDVIDEAIRANEYAFTEGGSRSTIL